MNTNVIYRKKKDGIDPDIKNLKSKQKSFSEKKETRLEQMKKDKIKRVDSDKMTDIEKMDKGFNGNTYSINGKDVDF